MHSDESKQESFRIAINATESTLAAHWPLQNARRHFDHIAAQLIPAFGLGKDRVAQSARRVAALFRFPDFEDQFHGR